MADNYPLINGNERDGSSVKIRFLKQYWRGLQTITYGDALEPNYIYELGSVAPIAMTRGQWKPEDGSLEVLRSTADEIRTAMRRAKRVGWGFNFFQMQIHYDDGNRPITDVIVARVTKAGNEAKQGADANIEKWTFKPMSLSRGGIYLYK